jgi:hypothetical protein
MRTIPRRERSSNGKISYCATRYGPHIAHRALGVFPFFAALR